VSLGTSSFERRCILIPDTSALLLIAEGIDPLLESKDVLADYCIDVEIRVLTPVMRELRRLASGKGSKAVAARLALTKLGNYAEVLTLVDLEGCSGADECILDYSKTLGAEVIVVTTDRKLAIKLRKAGIKHIAWWRSRKKFVLNFPVSQGDRPNNTVSP